MMSTHDEGGSVMRRALAWIGGRDTGVSSNTIWAVMVDAVQVDAGWLRYAPPADPDDFGRCHRLLAAIPEWRPRLAEVSARFPEWGPLVDAWDEMDAMYRAVVAGGGWNREASGRMYDRMKELEDAGRVAAGWERMGASSWRRQKPAPTPPEQGPSA